MLIRGAVRSDVGRVRRENEDTFGFFPDVSLYAVADGMGGHAAGQVASALTIEAMHQSLLEVDHEDLTPVVDANGNCSVAGRRLMIALYQANERVLDASRKDESLKGMGTTVAAVLFDQRYDVVAICHVGDSRVYRIREDRIEQLTRDHTVVQRLLQEGRIEPDEIASSPHRHLLTQAVGTDDLIHPELRLEQPVVGDTFVLTSDGVHDGIEEHEVLAAVRDAGGDLEQACTRLVDLANERGGKDNSTVLIVSYEEPRSVAEGPDDPTQAT